MFSSSKVIVGSNPIAFINFKSGKIEVLVALKYGQRRAVMVVLTFGSHIVLLTHFIFVECSKMMYYMNLIFFIAIKKILVSIMAPLKTQGQVTNHLAMFVAVGTVQVEIKSI